LQKTREVIRKRALKLCFMRTLIMVAQSKSLTEKEQAWKETQKGHLYDLQDDTPCGVTNFRPATSRLQALRLGDGAATTSTSTSNNDVTDKFSLNTDAINTFLAQLNVVAKAATGQQDDKIIIGGGSSSSHSNSSGSSSSGIVGVGDSGGNGVFANMTVAQIGQAQSLLAQMSMAMGTQLAGK